MADHLLTPERVAGGQPLTGSDAVEEARDRQPSYTDRDRAKLTGAGQANNKFGFRGRVLLRCLMTATEAASDGSRPRCPVCRSVALMEGPAAATGTAPRCAHCRACGRAVLIAFLLPPALWLVGMPFEGRHGPAHPLFFTAAPAYYDLALVGFLIADLAFALWLVWYAVGLRGRVLALAVVQFLLCCFVVAGDFLWSAGPP
jgi:hypothetical protein